MMSFSSSTHSNGPSHSQTTTSDDYTPFSESSSSSESSSEPESPKQIQQTPTSVEVKEPENHQAEPVKSVETTPSVEKNDSSWDDTTNYLGKFDPNSNNSGF
jgi:hypothetical protein